MFTEGKEKPISTELKKSNPFFRILFVQKQQNHVEDFFVPTVELKIA